MFGISVYPYKEEEKKALNYIELAAKYGFGRVFTNLLMIQRGKEQQTLLGLKKIMQKARECQMEVILDVDPGVFEQLKISYNNLSFFKEMGATGIRLDSPFDGLIESQMTFDATNLDLEINLSYYSYYLENILSFKPNAKKIIGCHNFYPQRFTGLDEHYFIQCTKKYKTLNLRTAAFVCSQAADHGPHPYCDGLCTLEMHRDLPIVMQAKHLLATGLIDDILIANAFASETELKDLSELSPEYIELEVEFLPQTSKLERKIVLDHLHCNRGDINNYSIRSTFPRIKYASEAIPENYSVDTLSYGDITIGNDLFGQYKGELNIVKNKMPNSSQQKNVVARIVDNNQFLISYIKSWAKFKFKESTPMKISQQPRFLTNEDIKN